jgi:MATE family multidrug resistance protein
VLNIGLNYFLAIELNMNSQGIALGTVISEYAAVAFAVVMLLRQLKRQSLVLTSPWDVGLQIQLLKINLPLMLRTLLLHSVFVTLAVLSARLGIIEAAAIGLMLVLLATAAYALDGFAYAAEIEAGQALGERHLRRFIESLWAGAALSFVSAVMIVAGLMLFHTHIFSALTDFQDVIHQASELMAWFYWIVLVLCWSYWLDGVFIGLTKSLDMCIAMAVATSIGWFGSLWILEATTVDHLMAAFLIFSVVRVIALGIRLPAMVAEVRRLSALSRPEFEPV